MSFKDSKQEILENFRNAKKLPFFEYTNIAVKLTKDPLFPPQSFSDLTTSPTSSIPSEFTSLSIFLTDSKTHDYNFLRTNSHQYSLLHSLPLNSTIASEILSFFTLKILQITPNPLILSTAKSSKITLKLPKNFLKSPKDLFTVKEKANKRKILLSHLASTGWLESVQKGIQKMNEYEHKTVKEVIQVERMERNIRGEFYRQLDFPTEFQICLFLAFFAPFVSKFLALGWNYLKFKVKGK